MFNQFLFLPPSFKAVVVGALLIAALLAYALYWAVSDNRYLRRSRRSVVEELSSLHKTLAFMCPHVYEGNMADRVAQALRDQHAAGYRSGTSQGMCVDTLATLDLLSLSQPDRELFAQAPAPGSQHVHSNGAKYEFLFVANVHSQNFEKYPPTAVYRGENGLIWSRPLADWSRSMAPRLEPVPVTIEEALASLPVPPDATHYAEKDNHGEGRWLKVSDGRLHYWDWASDSGWQAYPEDVRMAMDPIAGVLGLALAKATLAAHKEAGEFAPLADVELHKALRTAETV